MTLLPRTLFGRNAVLIVLLIVLGQAGGALLLRDMVVKPRIAHVAQAVADNAAGIRAGLAALPPAQREAFIAAYNGRGRPAAEAAVAPDAQPLAVNALERGFVQAVTGRIAAQGGFAQWRNEPGGGLSLRMAAEGSQQWIVLPGLPARDLVNAFLAVSAGSALIALAGALWLQRRMNAPLERVADAAADLAAGGDPAPLPESGPQEVAALARSFNHMVHSLREAGRERALMLAGISHDLRTPLTKLRLGVEIVAARAEPELVASLERSMEEMDRIVRQFLDFARDERADAREPVDLNALVEEVRCAFADHGTAVSLEGEPLPPVPLRPEAMRRVLVNLLENALRHGAAPITMRTGADEAGVWLEVCDGGPGIAAGDAERLKQPFQRASARSGPAGSGLGLAIVDRIVRQHRGRFALLRPAAGGLCARVWLPGA